MYWYLLRAARVPATQIVVVHAHLGNVEHSGVIEHIQNSMRRTMIDTLPAPERHFHQAHVIRAVDRDGNDKDLLGMVRQRHAKDPSRPPWPSAAVRYCTSDLKRGPIEKFIRNDMKRRGATLAVNCIGLRAEESASRAKRETWTLNKRLSKAGRTVHDWLPIHHATGQMLRTWINRGAGSWHPAYKFTRNPDGTTTAGNERLSCAFCIFGCKGDLQNAARMYPELLAEYLAVEKDTGYTMFNGESLADRIGIRRRPEPKQWDLF